LTILANRRIKLDSTENFINTMSQTRAQLEAWRQQNPGLFRGLQRAISQAEGTWRANQPGYDILFGGGKFNDYSRHPDKVVRTPGYASAAAGAYQFMPATYAEAARELGLKDFSPESQDLAMLYKARQRLMPAGGLAAITKEGALSPRLQAYLAPEWASFPTEAGTSAYGQPVKRSSQISAWFDEASRGAGQNATQAAAAAKKQDAGLGLLNKFIDFLGVTGGLRGLGPQSSLGRPAPVDYSERGSSVDPGADLLVDLYKSNRRDKQTEALAESEALAQLQRNQAAMEQAKTQLLAQAISSFGEPVKLIS
jgi:muramidase (phage lysozyme)